MTCAQAKPRIPAAASVRLVPPVYAACAAQLQWVDEDDAGESGAADATTLGYVPLPETLVKQVKDYWATSIKAGS